MGGKTRGALATELEAIWAGALERLGAARLVREALAARPLPPGPIRVVALGKAAAPMLDAALTELGPRARDPLCILPHGSNPPASSGARVLFAAHPRPDAGSRAAGDALLAWAAANGATPALVLLSGGGSALAQAPADGLSPADKADGVGALMRAGATIHQLNAVRKHLSRLKGGRTGALLGAGGAPVRVLVLSDVPGDDLSVIASGPFAPDPTTFAEALALLGVADRAGFPVPPAVRARLEAGARGELEDTPKPGDPRLASVTHEILAGPVDLARTAAAVARERGFAADADPIPLTGDVAAVTARVTAWARDHASRGSRHRLLALGGEPTIVVPKDAATPDGGRAQALALLAARPIAGLPAAVLAAGSDGRDGPTEQAGAVVDGGTAAVAAADGVDLDAALAAARSGPAAVAVGAAIPRRDTGTHLCDVVLVAVG